MFALKTKVNVCDPKSILNKVCCENSHDRLQEFILFLFPCIAVPTPQNGDEIPSSLSRNSFQHYYYGNEIPTKWHGNEIPTKHPSELYTIYNPASRAKLTHLAFIQAKSTEVRYPWYSWLGWSGNRQSFMFFRGNMFRHNMQEIATTQTTLRNKRYFIGYLYGFPTQHCLYYKLTRQLLSV